MPPASSSGTKASSVPTTIVQKEIRARLSPIVRPVIFGNHQCSAAKPPKTAPPISAKWVAAVASVVFFRSQAAATIDCMISAARPIAIIAIAPAANSSGARILSVPPFSVAIRLKKIEAEGDDQRQRHQHREVHPAEPDRRGQHVLHPGERAEHRDRDQRADRRRRG